MNSEPEDALTTLQKDLHKYIQEYKTSVCIECINDVIEIVKSHTSTDGACPESIACTEGYRNAISQVLFALNNLKESYEQTQG